MDAEPFIHDLLEYCMEALLLYITYASTNDTVDLEQHRTQVIDVVVQAFSSYQSYAATSQPSAQLSERYRMVGMLFTMVCSTIGLADDADPFDSYDESDYGEDVPTGCTPQQVAVCCKRIEAATARNINDQTQCSICLDDYCENKALFRLYCNHVFHGDCLSTWLEKKRSCPLCKACVLDKPKPPMEQQPSRRRSKRLRGENP